MYGHKEVEAAQNFAKVVTHTPTKYQILTALLALPVVPIPCLRVSRGSVCVPPSKMTTDHNRWIDDPDQI